MQDFPSVAEDFRKVWQKEAIRKLRDSNQNETNVRETQKKAETHENFEREIRGRQKIREHIILIKKKQVKSKNEKVKTEK